MSFWIDKKTCNCNSDTKKSAGTVVFEGTTYCKYCRCKRESSPTTLSAIPTLDDTPYDYLVDPHQAHDDPFDFENSQHNPQYGASKAFQTTSQQSGIDEVPDHIDSIKKAGIWRYKFCYGVHDPILWIAGIFLALAAWATVFSGSGTVRFSIPSLIILIGVLSLVRWPLSAYVRSTRLNAAQQKSGFDRQPHWQVDPARLGYFRWYNNGWTDAVAGRAPRPRKSDRRLLSIGIFVIAIVLPLSAVGYTYLQPGGSHELHGSTELSSSFNEVLDAKESYDKSLESFDSFDLLDSAIANSKTKLANLTKAN